MYNHASVVLIQYDLRTRNSCKMNFQLYLSLLTLPLAKKANNIAQQFGVSVTYLTPLALSSSLPECERDKNCLETISGYKRPDAITSAVMPNFLISSELFVFNS